MKIIKIDPQYLPATCYVLTQQKYPKSWDKILQPYVAEIKRFTNIFKTQPEAIRRLLKLSDLHETELIQAAAYQLSIQKQMNYQLELDSIETNLQQYKKQLHYLQAPSNAMSASDAAIIGKHYSDNISALTIRKNQLIAAIEVNAEVVIPTTNFPKNNC